MKCSICGRTLTNKYKFCPDCGASVVEEKTPDVTQVVDEVEKENEKNTTAPETKKVQGFAIAGFVLSLVSIICGNGFATIVCATLGLIFSAISLAKFKPDINKGKGFSIAGLTISIVVLAFELIGLLANWTIFWY